MPLPLKTLREASIETGIPEAEIRALVNMNKIRAVLKKGAPTFAPDEIAKIDNVRHPLFDKFCELINIVRVDESRASVNHQMIDGENPLI